MRTYALQYSIKFDEPCEFQEAQHAEGLAAELGQHEAGVEGAGEDVEKVVQFVQKDAELRRCACLCVQ